MGRTRRSRQRKRYNQLSITCPSDFLSPLFNDLTFLGWRNTKNLTVRNFEATGRGVCSKTATFHERDALIQLPLKCLITISTLDEDAEFKTLFDIHKFTDNQRVPFQSLLAFYILYQKHLKDASHIHTYINSIPTHFSTPYFCSIAELKCLPDAILEKTVMQNRQIRESYVNFKNVFSKTCCSYCAEPYFDSIYTLDAFKWAFFAVNTRSVYMNSRQFRSDKLFFKAVLNDEPDMALAPFLDLFNHAADLSTNAGLQYNDTNKQYEFSVTLEKFATKITPYTQLFISYGTLSNFKLLLEYGFVLKNNPHDYFQFSLSDIEDFLKNEPSYNNISFHRSKYKFIRDHNLNDQMFVHLDDGISHNLHVVLHVLLKEPSHYPNILNHVAFGAVNNLANVRHDVRLLIARKINVLQMCIVNLEKLPTLTDSGSGAKKYLKECICYLQRYLNIYS